MADDVFNILGKVEVDLGALKASLGAAEAAVRASTERQAKSYTDFANIAVEQQRRIAEATKATKGGEASNLYQMKFGGPGGGPGGPGGGPGGPGGGGPGGGFGGIAEHLKNATEHVKNLHQHLGLTSNSIRGFSHVLNMVAPGLGSMARGMLMVLSRFGPFGLAAAAAIGIIARYVHVLELAATRQYEMGRALKTLDFDRLNKMVMEADEHLAKQADLTKRANAELAGLDATTSVVTSYWKQRWSDVSGANENANATLRETAVAWVTLYQSVGGPGGKAALANQMAVAKAMEDAAHFAIQLADTSDKLTISYASLAVSQHKTYEATLAQIQADQDAEIAKTEAIKGSLAYAAITVKFAAERAKAATADALQSEKNAQAQKVADAALVTALVKTEQTILDLRARRAKSANDLAIAEVKAAAATVQGMAASLGTTVSNASAIEFAYKREIAGLDAVEARAKQRYAAEAKDLKDRISRGVDAEANRQALAILTETRETEAVEHINKKKEQAANKEKELILEVERVRKAAMDRRIADIDRVEKYAQAQAQARGEVKSGVQAIKDKHELEVNAISDADYRSKQRYEKEEASITKTIAAKKRVGESVKADEEQLAALKETLDAELAAGYEKRQDLRKEKDFAVTMETERFRAVTVEKNIRDTEAYFGTVKAGLELRKSMGADTFNGEVSMLQQQLAVQLQINEQTKNNYEKYQAGLKTVLDIQKQIYDTAKRARDEAKSDFSSLATAAADYLKKKTGRKKFSAAELQDAVGEMRQQNIEMFGGFSRGGKADIGALTTGMGQQDSFNKLFQQGGSLGGLFNKAITPVAPMFNTFNDSTNTFAMAVDKFSAAIDADADASQRGKGNKAPEPQYLKDPSKNKLSEDIGRQTYLEGQRAPAENVSAI